MYLSHDDEQDNISVFCDSVPDNNKIKTLFKPWRRRLELREGKIRSEGVEKRKDHIIIRQRSQTVYSVGNHPLLQWFSSIKDAREGKEEIGPPGDDPVDFHLQPATCERCETVIRRGRRYSHQRAYTSRRTARSSQSTRSRSGHRPPEIDKRVRERACARCVWNSVTIHCDKIARDEYLLEVCV